MTTNKYVALTATAAQIGDKVVGLDGEGTISAIVEEIEAEPVYHTTYIISVEDNENFFAEGVLVHNK